MEPTEANSSQAVDVLVNDVRRAVPAGTSLLGLLDLLALSARPGLAVAVNAAVVPRGDWASRALRSGDDVLVIHASQGG